jgi:hypothetical protein
MAVAVATVMTTNVAQAAIKCYDKALQLDSRCSDAYVGRGAAHVNMRCVRRGVCC